MPERSGRTAAANDDDGRDPLEAARALCLALPEVSESISHGATVFRTASRQFATLSVNHHGDGHVALLLRLPEGAQGHYVGADPENYYVPAYVGPSGWLGVSLIGSLPWSAIRARVHEAWTHSVPARLAAGVPSADGPPLGAVEAPSVPLDPETLDPWCVPAAADLLERLRRVCLSLPESVEARQFGDPAWKAGRKTFCVASRRPRAAVRFSFRVGAERQSLLAFAPGYRIPAYAGHNGWIELEPGPSPDWQEIEGLVLESYRHFALKRMLKVLDGHV